jgi:uncharacterized protein (TIGR04222 family)
MDWLTNNPVAGMYGPHFLVFYGIVIAITLLGCALVVHVSRSEPGLPPPPVPPEPDPYEIAYLRGGVNELTRAVVFNLIQRGYLCVEEEKKRLGSTEQRILHHPKHPDPRHLSAPERRAFDWFRTPHTVAEIFRADLPSLIEPYAASYEQSLRAQGLLADPEQQGSGCGTWLTGAAVIAGLGGYKLAVAVARGRHNVGFLILMGIVGLVLLGAVCFRSRRLTARGQAYLRQVQLAFEGLKRRAPHLAPGVPDPALALLVGVFGVAALTGTPYDYYNRMFRQSESSGGSCGSGCGSSCGGGGCGGGGCGGCGS